jgi:mono/diheme cytochrome c family protein
VLANILLHGVTARSGGGENYEGAMPAFHQLGDAELAAVASYIRSAWSNKAAAVGQLFAQERKASDRAHAVRGRRRSRPGA